MGIETVLDMKHRQRPFRGGSMKALLVNGSPHKQGCTNRALEEVASALDVEGIETQILWIGAKPVGG